MFYEKVNFAAAELEGCCLGARFADVRADDAVVGIFEAAGLASLD